MENLDLNIDNYSLQDLLNLFKLPYNFTDENLKQAQRIVYKTHPDKSQLDKKYFLFFMKALKTLVALHNITNKKTNTREELAEFKLDKNEVKKQLDNKNFNKWFNETFEKLAIKNEKETGYEDWLRSNADLDAPTNVSMSEMDTYFQNKKKECKSLILHKDFHETDNTTMGHTELSSKQPDEYTSGLFSKLQYDDLKKAHTQSVVPVTHQDYLDRPQFNSVDEYITHRDTQKAAPMDKQKSRAYLNKQNETKQFDDLNRAFDLHQQNKIAREINEKFKSQFNMIKN
jgi:hypothetical protein